MIDRGTNGDSCRAAGHGGKSWTVALPALHTYNTHTHSHTAVGKLLGYELGGVLMDIETRCIEPCPSPSEPAVSMGKRYLAATGSLCRATLPHPQRLALGFRATQWVRAVEISTSRTAAYSVGKVVA